MFLGLVIPVTEKEGYWKENQAGREMNQHVHHKQLFGKLGAVETQGNRDRL